MTSDYPKNIVSNDFLSPPTEFKTPTSKHRRSVSDAGSGHSASSSLSRITYVEEDAQIFARPNLEDSDSIIVPDHSCLDHLVAIIRILFCLPIPKKIKTRSPEHVKAVTWNMESSPWVLSVSVLSTRKDSDKQPVAKRAKCTIDTGNMQGNIVSRDFVENVLEYSEANFLPLTAQEREGGFGITGHKLVPEGAIYLTWWHNKSTRVFHKMRFLISPQSQCDLIIGARSIQKDNLLGVPNLIATVPSKIATTKSFRMDEEEQELEKTFLKLDKRYQNKEIELLEAGEDTDNNKILKEYGEARDIADKYHQIRRAEVDKNQKLAVQLKEDLEKLPGYVNDVVPSKSHTTSSGLETKDGAVPVQRAVKKTNETSPPEKKK